MEYHSQTTGMASMESSTTDQAAMKPIIFRAPLVGQEKSFINDPGQKEPVKWLTNVTISN